MAVTCSVLGNQGRIGNQLFQVAGTVGLARQNNLEVSLPDWDYRPYFSVPGEWWTPPPTGEPLIDAMSLTPEVHPVFRNYLQNFGYWSDIQDDIWAWFQPSEMALGIMRQERYDPFWVEWQNDLHALVSLHVRRGDNVTNPPGTIKCLEDAYFLRAVESVEAEVTRDPLFMVFSDDMEWCRAVLPGLLPGRDLVFIDPNYIRPKEHLPEYQTSVPMDWVDMLLMAECDYHILSNSTYSWWGAFLSPSVAHPRYPSYWFGHRYTPDFDPSVLFPSDWVKIPCSEAP